ncbi:MAG: hypothetical protein AAF685_02660 [Cyanobacteria bacterium P01_C01_bin.89]
MAPLLTGAASDLARLEPLPRIADLNTISWLEFTASLIDCRLVVTCGETEISNLHPKYAFSLEETQGYC